MFEMHDIHIRTVLNLSAPERHHGGEGGGDGRRTHSSPADGGRAHPAGGGRHTHHL